MEVLGPKARRAAFATVTFAFAMDVIDSTIVNVAIPSIQADLGAGGLAVQWLTAGYFLSLALLIVTGGRLGDLYGYRRAFCIGMAGFTVASLLCGLAQTPAQLVLARGLQGVAAAVMVPQVMSVIQLLYPPVERVKALAVFGVLGGVAAVLGPILGGTLIELAPRWLGWRLIFMVNVPVGVAGVMLGVRFLPVGRSSHPLRLDPIGTALLALALGCLLFPLIQGREFGWPWWCLGIGALSVPTGGLLVAHSRNRIASTGSALLVPDLLRERCFAVGLLMSLLFSAASAGFFLVLTISLQVGLGYSPLAVAGIHVPFAIGATAGISAIARRWLPRFGRFVPMAGSVIFAVGITAVAVTATGGKNGLLLASMAVAGLGMGTASGPIPPITLARMRPGYAGFGSGMLKAAQQTGGAMGVAALGSIYFGFLPASGSITALQATIAGCVAASLAVLILGTLLPTDIFLDPDGSDANEP